MITIFGLKFSESGSLLLEKVSDNAAAIPSFESGDRAREYLKTKIDERYQQLLEMVPIDRDLIETTRKNNAEIEKIFIDLQ